MELCSMFLLLAVGILVFLVACVVNSDADLTLMFADKFGRKLGNSWSEQEMYGSKLLYQRSHLSLFEGDLRGKVVWITGASTGIGAALAIEAAKYGAKVAISARTHGKLEETKKICIGRGK